MNAFSSLFVVSISQLTAKALYATNSLSVCLIHPGLSQAVCHCCYDNDCLDASQWAETWLDVCKSQRDMSRREQHTISLQLWKDLNLEKRGAIAYSPSTSKSCDGMLAWAAYTLLV